MRSNSLVTKTGLRRAARPGRAIPFLLLAFVVQVVGLELLHPLMPYFAPKVHRSDKPMEVMFLPLAKKDKPKPDDDLEKKDEEKKEPEGQIVEIAPPEDQSVPDEAKFLAEYNSKVKEETRSDRFKVNPDVLARTYSEQSKAQLQANNLLDMHATQPSTGSQSSPAGEDRFDPDRDGTLASLPGHLQLTNQLGTGSSPVPSTNLEAELAGAPQNDMLDVKRGHETALNAKEYLYAGYLNRIRRLVNFYWKQNVDNLADSSVRLAKPEYTTGVNVVLEGDGSLELCEVTRVSGSPELDDAVVRAFRIAGPFPNPPAGLIKKDGRVYLPDMSFTVTLGQARIDYEGIDPRAGVQFPGILKSPR